MKNVLREVSELDQANPEAPALGLLVAQSLLELLRRDKSSRYQEIPQSRQLRGCRRS